MRSKDNPRAAAASAGGAERPRARPQARPRIRKPGKAGGGGQRRSFSQRTLALESDGPQGALLGEALRVPAGGGYQLTHAFHAYPGRFHPALPRTLLAALARPGQRVLDPFMGGGTTLVEAQLLGLEAWGNDLSPVALLVARERTRLRTAGQARGLEAQARAIAAQVEALRRDKHPPRALHLRQHELGRFYAPHLLAELMQWHRLIEAAPAGDLRESLRAVLSSAAVKFSNLESDSKAEAGPPPRFGKGAVTRLLVARTHELAQAQAELARRIPRGTPAPRLLQEDARLLPSLGWGEVDWVLTSPPYPGTYDYLAQHRLRMDWLGLDDAAFAAGEIGARRRHGEAGAEESWSESVRAVLATLARVLRPGGGLFLVLGDWITGEHAVDALAMLTRTAAARGWQLASRASVQRDVHSRLETRAFAKRGKWEHLLHFTRAAADATDTDATDTSPVKAAAPGAAPRTRKRPRQRSKGGRIRTL
jgi:DNA modification methylase